MLVERSSPKILLNGVTSGTGPTVKLGGAYKTVSAAIVGTGTGTIEVYGALAGDTTFLPLQSLTVTSGAAAGATFGPNAYEQFYATLGNTGSGLVTCKIAGVM